MKKLLDNVAGAFRRTLRAAKRAFTSDGSCEGIHIQPYRGYGTRKEVFLMGRVFRQKGAVSTARRGIPLRNIMEIGRRLLRRRVAGAVLEARFGGAAQRVSTDRDGYFRVHLRSPQFPPGDGFWHHMELELTCPPDGNVRTSGELFVPPESARYVVISDIDDTVIYTGVANKAMMLWRMFLQEAKSRIAFPGVASFYRALHRGASGAELNPLLYVSRGPWSLYEVLDAFFNMHAIPNGPVLFLRDWGLSLSHPFPRRGKDHKLTLIRDMLSLYSRLPFVLIGDSGQRDPEVYARIVRERPGRVRAIYIRNVSREPERRRAIESLAEEVAAAGSSLLLAADSLAMAEDAVKRGLISAEALSEVVGERAAEKGEPGLRPTEEVKGRTPRETRKAVEEGELRETLEGEGEDAGDRPPNVLVEPERGKDRQKEGRP